MMNNVLRGIILALLLLAFRLSSAQVMVNEIMYNPTQSDSYNEWVEILNSGPSDVDLTTLTICGKGIKAGYIKRSDGATYLDAGLTMAGGQYAVITDGPASGTEVYDNFSVAAGALALHIDGSASICSDLSNDGKTISLGGPGTDSVTYDPSQGANNDGNSLQRQTDGSWTALVPTPGAANSTSGGGGGNDGGDATSTTAQTTTPTVYKIAVDIVSKTAAVAGVPIDFSAKATGLSGEPLTRGKFSWNLGDGFAKTESETQKFSYTYFYPGDYLVILEYCSSSYYCPAPDATDRQLIKVLPASVTISAAGLLDGASVELTNSSGTEADLGRWMLDGAAHDFILAPNTLILAGKKIILPARVTGFTADDLSKIYLRLPGGEVVSEYPPAIPPPVVPVTASTDAADASLSGEFSRSSGRVASEVPPSAEQTKLAQPDARKFPDSSALSLDQRSDLKETSQGPTLGSENLAAAATQALPERENGKPLWPWLLGTAGVAGLAAAAILLGKGSLFPSTAVAPKPSDDFKLIDE